MSSCVAITVLITGGASAFAADLPSRTVVPVAPVVPIFTWTGFYGGLNAGYGWNVNDNRYYDPVTGLVQKQDSDGGFVGGGQIGYNYQLGQFVGGVEADIHYADLSSGDKAGLNAPQSKGVDWLGTVRARLGFALDRALIYATGGFAYGGRDKDDNYTTYYDDNDKDFFKGWTVGGGIEYAFSDNLTAKVEGLYINFGKDKSGNNAPVFESPSDIEFGLVRAGVNYKFSGF
jgi:outer membrane immunogenic protein